MSKVVNVFTVGPTESGQNPGLTPEVKQAVASFRHNFKLHEGATIHMGWGLRFDEMYQALGLAELDVPIWRCDICGEADYQVVRDPGTGICRTVLKRRDNTREDAPVAVALAQYFYYGVEHEDIVIIDAEMLCKLTKNANLLAERANAYQVIFSGDLPRLVQIGAPPNLDRSTLHVYTD